MNNPEYILVETDAQLLDVIDAVGEVSAVAVDTEFARFNTYYPIVGLVQICTGHDCFLIDPIAIEDLSPLTAILVREDLLKVFHACSEDMEVFQHALGAIPTPVYDTQIAAAALGLGFSVGYQAMVEECLGITLPKDQTRSDWLARPLSNQQLDYAALDVIYLLQVYNQQLESLEGSPKLGWIEAESAGMGQEIPTMVEPAECYLRLKGLWQLDRRQLNLIRTLFAWRERTARREDLPRNRVVDQKALMNIVRLGLTDRRDFQKKAGMTPRQVRKHGDDLLFQLAEARQTRDVDCPELIERDEKPVSSSKMKLLKRIVEERAKALSVAPELLTKRRHLEKLIRSSNVDGTYHLPEELGGWRAQAIGHDLLEALNR